MKREHGNMGQEGGCSTDPVGRHRVGAVNAGTMAVTRREAKVQDHDRPDRQPVCELSGEKARCMFSQHE